MKLKHFTAALLATAVVFIAAGIGIYAAAGTEKRSDSVSQQVNPSMRDIEKAFDAAVRSGNGPEAFKALIQKVNAMGRDDSYKASDLLDTLKAGAGRMPQPGRSLAYSFIGDFLREYWEEASRWSMRDRTAAEIGDKDIDTWDTERLFREALKYYMMSVEDNETAKTIPLSDYAEVLRYYYEQLNSLPTLYDFLTFRAVQALGGQFSAAMPGGAFVVNDPAYFSDAREFSVMEIPVVDSLSSNYHVLSLYQQLLAFRLSEVEGKSGEELSENRYALVNADIERLRFVRSQGVYPDGDALYEKALKSMADRYAQWPESGYYMYELAVLYNGQGDSGKQNPRYRNRYREAYDLSEKIIKDFPGSRPASYATALQRNIAAPEARFTFDTGQIPDEPILALAEYRNLDKIFVNIYEWNESRNMSTYDLFETENNFNTLKKVYTQQVSVPLSDDFQRFSAEVAIDALPQGRYLMVASPAPIEQFRDVNIDKLFATTTFTVSPLAIVYRETTDNKGSSFIGELTVYDRKSGRPVPGARFEYWIYNYNRRDRYSEYGETYKGSFTADPNGVVRFPISRDYTNFKRGVATSPEGGSLTVYALPGWRGGNYGRDNENAMYSNEVIFTDRSIYRPGQTVYYKVLSYMSNNAGRNELMADQQVSVSLHDVTGQQIESQILKTGEFGTASGSFVIPQGLLNGAMTLRTYRTAQQIRVEEYKRPTFEVEFDPVKGNYRLGDHVEISGKAVALAGYAVDNAAVQYNIVRTPRYRFYYWWMPPVTEPARQIASGQVVTADDGAFTIAFDALADDIKNEGIIYDYRITADVTDINGETRSSAMSLRLSDKPLMVETSVPERITDRSSLVFSLAAVNLNGDPTSAQVSVTVTALEGPDRILRPRRWGRPDTAAMAKADFIRLFPNDIYMGEDMPSSFAERGNVVSLNIGTRHDTKAGANLDLREMADQPAGWYRIDFDATAQGVNVMESRYIQLAGEPIVKGKKGAASPITSMDQWLTVVNTTVEPGGYAEFAIASARENTYARYEVVLLGDVIDSRQIEAGPVPQSVRIPVTEDMRGGFSVGFLMLADGRAYTTVYPVVVPYSNKMVDIEFVTFRDKLQPGQQETWKLRLRAKDGDKIAAEMVAALYDASLDAIAPHAWVDAGQFYPQRGSYYDAGWNPDRLYGLTMTNYMRYHAPSYSQYSASYPYLNTFDREYTYSFSYGGGYHLTGMVRGISMERRMMKSDAGIPPSAMVEESSMDILEMVSDDAQVVEDDRGLPVEGVGNGAEQGHEQIALRENFDETAFFYPELRTDGNGDITIEFTIPEALTRWKMLGFAHTKDMMVGSTTNTLITQKEVAISANAPRFFREGDKITFTAKVNNVSEAGITGDAVLRLYDAATMQPVDSAMLLSPQSVKFSVPQGQSAGVSWQLTIPAGVEAVTYQLTARAGDHTDGEQKTVPVMTNSMLVTETMPFYVRAGETKEVEFTKMKEHGSSTLRDYRYTLEFTSNPAWYAVQAMPYLMEYPYECAEQVFSRFYANSLSSAIVSSTPRIKEIFESWYTTPGSNALLSNLEKNEELKQVLFEETPWVMQATDESERKKRMGLLFDLTRMAREQRRAMNKLRKYQYSHGGFPWFDKLPADRFITQHIVAGIGHLRKLNALDSEFSMTGTVMKALDFLDTKIRKDYDELLATAKKSKEFDLKANHLSYTQLHYLYASSFSGHKPSGKSQLEAFNYYYGQARTYWKDFNLYGQALAALVFERYGNKAASAEIIAKIRSEAQRSEEMGMYWRENVYGYFWYQAPIETQALLIEAFNEIARDTQSVEEMKIWLLRNKQTNDWRTTKATSEACFALLMTGGNLLEENRLLEVTVGGKPLAEAAVEELKAEEGTGYVKTAWMNEEISPLMADVTVANPNNSGMAWGGLYWQYFEQLDKITSAETNLSMEKELFVKRVTDRGEVLEPLKKKSLKVGDLVTVRLVLRADRNFEYVHLKDMRGAAFEPVNNISGYRRQDALWYYESIKDASTNFFMSYLPKGTYVFEYDLRVTHSGDFSNGITTIQCMYAPEFSSHSEGIRVKVE